MPGYVELPVEVDEDALLAAAVERIQALFPGWQLTEAHLEAAILEEAIRLEAETRQVARSVAAAAFGTLLTKLHAVPAIDGAPATAPSTWTMVDAAGYTVPAGTVVAYETADGLVPFETVEDFTVPAGSTATAAGAVTLAARDNGVHANGLPAGTLVLVDALTFVTSVASTAATAGGVDPETDEEHIDRGADILTTLAPRPILPADFSRLARSVAGVHRATTIDGYNPADATYNNERMVTVAAVDANGDPLAASVKTDLADTLEAEREVNFIVHVIDPTYTGVDIVFTATALPGYVPADVEARAEAAVFAYLDPGSWGGGAESPPQWRRDTRVRYLEVAQVINNVDGVDIIDSLTIDGASADVVMAGVAPLPSPTTHPTDPTTVAGTVTAP